MPPDLEDRGLRAGRTGRTGHSGRSGRSGGSGGSPQAAGAHAGDLGKRLMDLTLSAVALVVGAPIMAAVALASRRAMGSPVLFRQVRAGQYGEPFELIKFRTMRAPRPGEDEFASDGDRMTPLGNLLRSTSLDELPTLVNVVRGDMSLVGPRPLPVAYLPRYTPEQARRHDVRPGITGWAQVNGRNSLSWARKFDLDLWYVDHRSLGLDLRILGRTVVQVFRQSGIEHHGSATMPEFMGSGASRGAGAGAGSGASPDTSTSTRPGEP